MPSLTARFYFQIVKQRLQRLRQASLSIPEVRAMREADARKTMKLPRRVRVDTENFSHVSGEWILPSGAPDDSVILYLHGGGYYAGSCVTHRVLVAHLAKEARLNALTINYRLAPEHPFPAALDDAYMVYRSLMQRNPALKIAIVGDSAGGGLAVALALKLRDNGLACPAALGLLSPWLDLTLSCETHDTLAAQDPYFPSREKLSSSAKMYAANIAADHPYVSPMFADLRELPPTLIHVGEREALLGDSQQLAARMTAANQTVILNVWPGMWHVWQHFAGKMREADDSLTKMGIFLHDTLAQHGNPETAVTADSHSNHHSGREAA